MQTYRRRPHGGVIKNKSWVVPRLSQVHAHRVILQLTVIHRKTLKGHHRILIIYPVH